MLYIVTKDPGSEPVIRQMPHSLEGVLNLAYMQLHVGGMIEQVPPQRRTKGVLDLRGVDMYVDEEGLMKGLRPNILGLVGPILACGWQGGGESVGLSLSRAGEVLLFLSEALDESDTIPPAADEYGFVIGNTPDEFAADARSVELADYGDY